MSKQRCLSCSLADPLAVVRSWTINSHHDFQVSGCYKCNERHAKQVRALQSEVTSVRAALVKSEATHQAEISRLTTESSLALMNKNAEYEQLLSEVKMLKDDNNRQRRMVQFLKLQPAPPYESRLLAASAALKLRRNKYQEVSVLVAKSPAVQNALTEGEGQAGVDQIKSLLIDTSPVLTQVTNFCHSGDFTFSELVRAEEVLILADELQIGFLKELCEAELCRQLSVHNVPGMLKLARQFETPKLLKQAEKLFRENFDILKTKVFDVLTNN